MRAGPFLNSLREFDRLQMSPTSLMTCSIVGRLPLQLDSISPAAIECSALLKDTPDVRDVFKQYFLKQGHRNTD